MKNFIIKSLAWLNMIEGIIHIVGSTISFWGMFEIGVWDWRVATAPTADLFLGVVSIITSIVLKNWAYQQPELQPQPD